ncbi:MAG TPA: aminoglycoside phosphotransferase family protein [Nocardioides sp.]|nr:aminoglycoside phosphotransferase family protein [Nocardioides sp.]
MTRMHDEQVDVDADVVRRLLRDQFPEWADVPITPVAESGSDHALFRLGEHLVARMPVIAWADGQAAAEARWLPRLAPALPVEVPVPVALGKPDADYPFGWSVHPWVEGDRLDPTSLDRRELARDLAELVAALRACDTDGAPLSDGRGAPLHRPARDQRTRESLERAADVIDAPAALRVWEEAQAAPAWEGPLTWLHGDLTPGNLIVRDGWLSGVVDWAPTTGDPAVELHSAYQLFDPVTRGVYRDTLADDDATWLRARGWAVSIAATEIPYYRETRPEFAARSIAAIEAVLAE